jgi:hypothetical protein
MILVAFLLAQEAGRFTTVTDESGVGKIVSDAYAVEPKWQVSGIHLIDLLNDGKAEGRRPRLPRAAPDRLGRSESLTPEPAAGRSSASKPGAGRRTGRIA